MLQNIIVKVASVCNINCQYCYVDLSRDWTNTARIMSHDTLETVISRVAEYCSATTGVERFVFYWHGGEPLLAGRDFFEEAVRIQSRYMPDHIETANNLQTNGLLLNRNWIDLLSEHNFDICVSLDGPAAIHDVRRCTKDGHGTYDSVVSALDLLRNRGMPVSILAVVVPEALPYGREIYQHFRDLGCEWMDFMYPMCNAIDNTLGEPIEPARWGHFYADLFDAWMDEGNPHIYIRQLHDWCMLLLRGKTAMCSSQSDCSYVLTVNTDGAVFVCDDLMPYCDSRLGNIYEQPLGEIARKKQLRQLAAKETLYGSDCLSCHYFPVCQGGCTLFRVSTRDDFSARHYYCEAQRLSIEHVSQRLAKETGLVLAMSG